VKATDERRIREAAFSVELGVLGALVLTAYRRHLLAQGKEEEGRGSSP
jgi:hypothetical protein